ncbi:MAG TPA: hypothetical protein VF184_07905, partial [Phycisphaeraceae bacterium]
RRSMMRSERIILAALTATGLCSGISHGATVALYSFDEGSGTTIADISDNGHDATIMGSNAQWTSGVFGGAVDFNGTSFGKVLNSSGMVSTGSWTVET